MTVSMHQMQEYRRLVNQFEQVARENIEKVTQVRHLCRLAGLNQRTLSRAFREVHGMGPARYLQQLRLTEARRLFLAEDVSVTEVAMRFGFPELGYFGVLYRKAFGESPSETKRHRPAVDRELQGGAPPISAELE